jgi:hypothetical protein
LQRVFPLDTSVNSGDFKMSLSLSRERVGLYL